MPEGSPRRSGSIARASSPGATAAVAGAYAAAPSSPQRAVDPFLNLPYATVPPTLLPVFERCAELAVFLVAATYQVVAGQRKAQAIMLSSDALYIMKTSGEIARRLDFDRIKGVVTNVAMLHGVKSDEERKKFHPFALFVMSEAEACDALFVDQGVSQLVSVLKRVLHATAEKTAVKFEAVTVRRASELGIIVREPQSQRDGVGEGDRSRLQSREAVAQLYYEKVLAAGAGAGGEAAAVAAAAADASDSASFLRHQAALRGDSALAAKRDPVSQLPYGRIPPEYEPLYPRLKSNQFAILWFSPVFHYYLLPERTHSSNLQFRHAFLTCERLHVADREDAYLRCLQLDTLSTIYAPADFSLLKPKVSLPDDAASHCTCGLVLTWHGNEHDLFLGFINLAQQQTFVAALHAILKAYCPTVAVRMQRCGSITECRAMLMTPPGYTAPVVDVPRRVMQLPPALSGAAAAAAKSPTAAARGSAAVAPLPLVDVPKELCLAYPPLTPAAVLWAERVALHMDPGSPNAGITMCVAFITATHLYIASRDAVLRCLRLDCINKLLLRAVARKSSDSAGGGDATKRNFVILVAEPPQHDMMLEVREVDAIKAFFAVYIRAYKGRFPHHKPTLGSFDEELSNSLFRYTPYPTYALDAPALPRNPAYEPIVQRLKRMYQRYDPAKLTSINVILANFKGNEEAMFAKLVEKYGPEPPHEPPPPKLEGEVAQAPPDAAAPRLVTNEGQAAKWAGRPHKERLVAFCNANCPDKLPMADAVLEKYRGREDTLFANLAKQYGPEPDPPAATSKAQTAATPNSDVGLPGAAAGTEPASLRERLIRFYQHYDSSKVASVDGVLTAFRGKEDELMPQLVARYGPEPPSPAHPVKDGGRDRSNDVVTAVATTTSSTAASPARARLERFYSHYDTTKLANIDALLQGYAGREEELFRRLTERYGPEPESQSEPQRRNTRTSPPTAVTLPAREQAEIALDPSKSRASYRDRLLRFTQCYLPSQVDRVDHVLAANVGREEAMMQLLVARYGPEPGPASKPAAESAPLSSPLPPTPETPASSPLTAPVEPRTRARLARFYEHYDPSKATAANVDDVLRRFPGTDAELFAKLVAKYGPEPVDISLFAPANDVYSALDLAADLPYADIPPSVIELFPSLTSAAIYWFGRVGHWEPPAPPAVRHAFVTRTHLYVAENEGRFLRCVRLVAMQALFVNSKRPDQESQCAMLVKLHPLEHDLFLNFESDFAAKKLMWAILELLHRFHFHHKLPACAVASISESGIDAQCSPASNFVLDLAPIPKRARVIAGSSGGISGDGQMDAERNAAAARSAKGAKRGAAVLPSERVVFGSVPHVNDWVAQHEHRARIRSGNEDILPAGHSELGAFEERDDFTRSDPHAPSAARGVNPLQREQFKRHADSGMFGQAPGRRITVAGMHGGGSIGGTHFIEEEVDGAAVAGGGGGGGGVTVEAAAEEVAAQQQRELQALLHAVDLEHYAPLFLKKRITLDALLTYDSEDLAHFGVVYEKDRRTLLRSLADGALLRRIRGSEAHPPLPEQRAFLSMGQQRPQNPQRRPGVGAAVATTAALSPRGNLVLGSSDAAAAAAQHHHQHLVPIPDPGTAAQHHHHLLHHHRACVLTPSLTDMQQQQQQQQQRLPAPPATPAMHFVSPLHSVSAVDFTSPLLSAPPPRSSPRELWSSIAGIDGATYEGEHRDEALHRTRSGGGAPPPARRGGEGASAERSHDRRPAPMAAAERLDDYGYVSLLPPDPAQSDESAGKRSPSPKRLEFRGAEVPSTPGPVALEDSFDVRRQLSLLQEVGREQHVGRVARREYSPAAAAAFARSTRDTERAVTAAAEHEWRMRPQQQRRQHQQPPYSSPPPAAFSAGEGAGSPPPRTQPQPPPMASPAAAAQAPGPLASRPIPVNLAELSVEDVAVVLQRLGIGEHQQSFARTDGPLLLSLSKDDLRRRFRNDFEAADILWEWLGRRKQRMELVESARGVGF